MSAISKYIVLVERRTVVFGLASLVLAAAALFPRTAVAQAPGKIAADLQAVIAAPTTPILNWAKDVNGQRLVKVLITSNSGDPDLVALRADVLARGGSVYLRYTAVRALSALLPANQLAALAGRSDVQGISPNRLTALTASLLEYASGSLTNNVRTYSSAAAYSGLDGTGIGIAVLDSGIMPGHKNFANASGDSRVRRAVDFMMVGDATAVGTADWTPGVDASASLYPGSATMSTFETKIAGDGNHKADMYGHGSHVASVAAGRGFYQSADSTGIAPNANLYDVKVLNAQGFGQLSDVLAGIDWVIYHAKEYNIRVMNLSLAADSTETWQTDPLARAARSAVAAGITVVVAAGNFGQTSTGAERFGTISSPRHDPSVITVGSANAKGTAARNDDTVNLFSSRGPTRSVFIDAAGVRRVDNLLKPDLVAPGNKVLGVMSSDARGTLKLAKPSLLPAIYPLLRIGAPAAAQNFSTLMSLSGTSISAPVVSGAVALMLQANPGLTPPLIKAMLQYSAQPIAGANLLQQGAGLLNVDGAVALAKALRTDLQTAVDAGTIASGANLLAAGKSMPATTSTMRHTRTSSRA